MNFAKSTSLSFLVLICWVLSSCSKSTPSNLGVIPQDVNLVFTVDLFSILKKGNFRDFSNSELMSSIKKEVRRSNRRLYKVIDDVIDEPDVLGVDFKEKVFVFYTEKAEDEKYFCISIALKEEERFESFIKGLINKLDLDSEQEEELTYKYHIIENEVGVGWDGNRALLVSATNYSSRENIDFAIENLMTMKLDDSVIKNELFDKFRSSQGDISLLINSTLFENDPSFESIEEVYDFDLSDNALLCHFSFNEGGMSLTNEFVMNEEAIDFMDDYEVWNNEISSDMLKYLPGESLFLTSLSFNQNGYYELLADEQNFNTISKGFHTEFGFYLKDFVNSTTGDYIFSINDFNELEYTYTEQDRVYNPNKYSYGGGYDYVEIEKTNKGIIPMYHFMAGLNDNLLIEDIIENLPNSDVRKKSDYYELRLTGKYPEYMAFNDDFLLITNDKRSINLFLRDGYVDGLNVSDLKDEIIESNIYTAANLNYDDYPQNIKKELRKTQTKEERKLFKIFTDLLEGALIEQIGHNKLNIKIKIKDTSTNSLNTIIKLIDDNYQFLSNL